MKTATRVRLLVLASILVFVIFLVMRLFAGPPPVEIARGSSLVLELGGRYVEAPAASPLARLAGDDTRPLIDLLSTFRKAERDDRIESVVLRIQPLDIGWAKAEELRAAIRRLREHDKHTVAHLEIANFSANKELYVASAADEIFVTPGSAVPLVGLAAEYLYLGGLMEMLGIDFDVAKAGKYKSAVEVYSERGMSDASREMANSLLDDTYRRFVAALAEGRGLTPDTVVDVIDRGLVRSQRLIGTGLVDGELHLDQVLERELRRRGDEAGAADGGDARSEGAGDPAPLDLDRIVRHADYRRVDPASVGFEAKTRFALVYGTGPVVQGEAERSPFASSPTFASETLARALETAAEDPEIAAIVLRIDSPGGSALASELIWRAIQRARAAGKPVVASFSDVAASGGYYVASAVDAIVADPGTLTGSIGVFALRPTIGDALAKLEIGVETLTRGRHADLLLASRKLSDGAMARLQTSVLDTYRLFLTRVADGRSMAVEDVDQIAQGRVWTGSQAHERGLVDELGGIYTAVDRAKEAAGLDRDEDVYLVPFPEQKSLGEQILEAFQITAIRAGGGPFEWPAPLDRLVEWTGGLPTGSPLLIPPMLVEIH